MKKKITLKDLVMQVDKDQALTYLFDNMFYYDKDYSKEKLYEAGSNIFDNLQSMEPDSSDDMKLYVWHGLTDGYEIGYDISGIGYDQTDGREICYSLVSLPWNKWLGMQIDEDTLRSLSPAQIVGYSIYEMTFFGWTEEAIKEKLSHMHDGETQEE